MQKCEIVAGSKGTIVGKLGQKVSFSLSSESGEVSGQSSDNEFHSLGLAPVKILSLLVTVFNCSN